MNVVKNGDPEKVKRIFAKREAANNPIVKCPHCDAELRINKCDVYFIGNWSDKQVKCFSCKSMFKIPDDKVPADYVEPDPAKPVMIWQNVPGANIPVPVGNPPVYPFVLPQQPQHESDPFYKIDITCHTPPVTDFVKR
jgi:hypothetical protein